jgi:hypothetical protein
MFAPRSPLFVFAVVVALAFGTAAHADEATLDNCKVVKIDGTRLTLETPKGVQHTAEVASDARITLDGKSAKLSDLKEGTKMKITARKEGGTATILKIEASTK